MSNGRTLQSLTALEHDPVVALSSTHVAQLHDSKISVVDLKADTVIDSIDCDDYPRVSLVAMPDKPGKFIVGLEGSTFAGTEPRFFVRDYLKKESSAEEKFSFKDRLCYSPWQGGLLAGVCKDRPNTINLFGIEKKLKGIASTNDLFTMRKCELINGNQIAFLAESKKQRNTFAICNLTANRKIEYFGGRYFYNSSVQNFFPCTNGRYFLVIERGQMQLWDSHEVDKMYQPVTVFKNGTPLSLQHPKEIASIVSANGKFYFYVTEDKSLYQLDPEKMTLNKVLNNVICNAIIPLGDDLLVHQNNTWLRVSVNEAAIRETARMNFSEAYEFFTLFGFPRPVTDIALLDYCAPEYAGPPIKQGK
jgi:hypothetical protein